MLIEKIVISSQNASILENISGQTAVPTFACRSIAGLSIRQGQSVGFFVTLRKRRKSAFLERFSQVILPSYREFRGFTVDSKPGSRTITIGLSNGGYFLNDFESVGLNISFIFKNPLQNSFNLNDFLRNQ